MKLNFKNILIIAFLILVAWFAIDEYFDKKKLEKAQIELRTTKIKNDTLVQINDRQYTKLVADTLTEKQLRKKIDSFGIVVKNPVLAQEIKYIPITVEKPVEKLVKTDTTITAIDYYPKQENYFAKHTTVFKTKDLTATGKFEFQETSIKLVVSENEDGTYRATSDLPKYFNVTSIDVQSQPLVPTQKDRFGFIVGGSLGKEMGAGTEVDFFRLNAGIRFNKVYLMSGVSSDGQLDVGINIEL
ncbi:MAG: hypothetical protein CMH22_06370 [Methylophaga sp.]|nr:hypothetical protein [Methylophaga sp.]|tara:strand:- start:15486 stop:16214 length:729 start_codon:yes stop_codon:yes gene_type:complete